MINLFEEASRPVLYEHKDADFSYWGKGSSFLIASSQNYYWITAAHVIENMKGSVNSLRIFPSDNSRISLPFNEQYVISRGNVEDEDYKDILMLRINLHEFDASGDAPLIAQDIEKGLMEAEQLMPNDVLWIIGYPSENNLIDYEARKIRNTRSVIRAVYKGNSVLEHCHEMNFSTSIKLNDYDGLSGSPVFYKNQLVQDGEIIEFPMLVGMLLRGTASSKIGHFVSAKVIKNILSIAENT